MKDAEKAILENLRKTTLSHLSEYDYDVVIKAIEKYGITNLTGTTEKLVRDAVIKHGSHNQKTHGRSGKGGGGGGGGRSSTAKPKKEPILADIKDDTMDEMKAELKSVQADLGEGFADARNSGFKVKELQPIYSAQKLLDKASADLDNIKGAKNLGEQGKFLDRARVNIESALEDVDGNDWSNKYTDAAALALQGMASSLLDIQETQGL